MDAPNPDRRSLLFYATGATGATVLGSGAWPQTDVDGRPDGQTTRLTIEVAGLAPGAELQFFYEGVPYYIRRRTPEDVAAARATPLDVLPDLHGRNSNRPGADASDVNRTIPPFDGEDIGEWLLVEAICPHLGCVTFGEGAGDHGGWFCPCHGAHFDMAGRLRSGPARSNLAIPRAEFTDAMTLTLTDRGRFSFPHL